MKLKNYLFYDHDPDGSQRPVWLVVTFGVDGVPWDSKKMTINVSEYEARDIYDFSDDVIGCSIYLDELFPDGDQLGINLGGLYMRLQSENYQPEQIERFIIPVSDVVEIVAIGKEMFL